MGAQQPPRPQLGPGHRLQTQHTGKRVWDLFVWGFYPLAYEEDSKYDVTRRERTSREGKRGEAMQAAMDRSRWGRGQVPNPLGRGFMVRGEGFRAPRGGVEAVGQRVPGPLLSHFSCPPVPRQVKGKSSLASLTTIPEAGTRKDLRDRSTKPRRDAQEVSLA